MTETRTLRKRMSLRQLEKDINKELRYSFFKAWHHINKLPPSNLDSYYAIASLYGQPFKKRTVATSDVSHVWGGYSQHMNVLFPTWNRYYLLHLEDALDRAVPNSHVALHYWDETSTETLKNGLPKYLTEPRVQIDDFGNTIPNPLLNFKLPVEISIEDTNPQNVKPIGYVTKRYPYSGLMKAMKSSTETSETRIQNDYINATHHLKSSTAYLQENIIYHLQGGAKPILNLYTECLENDTYNLFSNILSCQLKDSISLEEASDEMLKVLGGDTNGLIAGANGDLSFKETAAFDPLFFLHMSNVDRLFWTWQRKHDMYSVTSPFTITDTANDKGLFPKFGQGPSPNQNGDQQIDMETPLDPFTKPGTKVCSKDGIDIEKQLHYSYSVGSLA